MTDKVFTPTVEMNEVLKSSGSHNKETALAATAELARTRCFYRISFGFLVSR